MKPRGPGFRPGCARLDAWRESFAPRVPGAPISGSTPPFRSRQNDLRGRFIGLWDVPPGRVRESSGRPGPNVVFGHVLYPPPPAHSLLTARWGHPDEGPHQDGEREGDD